MSFKTFFGLVYVILLAFSCQTNEKGGKLTSSSSPEELKHVGEDLAKKYCSGCHAFTDPDLLDKRTWKFGLLPQMGYRMGIYGSTSRESLIENNAGGQLVIHNNIFPEKPMVSEKEWRLIQQYFHSSAPETLPVPEKNLAIGIKNAHVEIPGFQIRPPMVSAMAYHSEFNQIFVADVKADYSTINVLDKNLQSLSTLALPSPVSHLDFKTDTILATLMGGFMPTDNPDGSIIKIFKTPGSGNEFKGFKSILKNLQRPVHSLFHDLNGDHHEDILVCEYGNHTGKLSLFLQDSNGQYARKILSNDPGATKTEITDLNQDGLPDIVALMAQGRERIDAYINQGNGNFQIKRLLQFPPIFGSVDFTLYDWNNDGFEDLIYVNGDNADYSYSLKPYHGLRIYFNDGQSNFHEVFFQHQNGAYKAIPYDFDLDTDTDIALISFFPDLINSPEEGFVYFENQGTDTIQFKLRTIEAAAEGRWLNMLAMDTDLNGHPELLLGSFVGMDVPGDSTQKVTQRLINNSPTLLKLKFN